MATQKSAPKREILRSKIKCEKWICMEQNVIKRPLKKQWAGGVQPRLGTLSLKKSMDRNAYTYDLLCIYFMYTHQVW